MYCPVLRARGTAKFIDIGLPFLQQAISLRPFVNFFPHLLYSSSKWEFDSQREAAIDHPHLLVQWSARR